MFSTLYHVLSTRVKYIWFDRTGRRCIWPYRYVFFFVRSFVFSFIFRALFLYLITDTSNGFWGSLSREKQPAWTIGDKPIGSNCKHCTLHALSHPRSLPRGCARAPSRTYTNATEARYTFNHINVHVRAHRHIYRYDDDDVCTCACMCMCVHVCVCMSTYKHTRDTLETRTNRIRQISERARVHTHARAYTRVHIHTERLITDRYSQLAFWLTAYRQVSRSTHTNSLT